MYENVNIESIIYESYIGQCFSEYLFTILKQLNLINCKLTVFTIRWHPICKAWKTYVSTKNCRH